MMDTNASELIKNYNWSVEFFNKGEYEQFWRNIRPTIEYLCKFIIYDLSINDKEYENLISGKISIEVDKITDRYIIQEKQKKEVKGKGLISIFVNLFYQKNDYYATTSHYSNFNEEKDIKNKFETYKKNLFHYYDIASEIGMHSGESEYNEKISAISCASGFEEFFLFLTKKDILTTKGKDIIIQLQKNNFNYRNDLGLECSKKEINDRDKIIEAQEETLKSKEENIKKLQEQNKILLKQLKKQKEEVDYHEDILNKQSKILENEKTISLIKIRELDRQNKELLKTITKKDKIIDGVIKEKQRAKDELQQFYDIYGRKSISNDRTFTLISTQTSINKSYNNYKTINQTFDEGSSIGDINKTQYYNFVNNFNAEKTSYIKLIIFKLDNVLININNVLFFRQRSLYEKGIIDKELLKSKKLFDFMKIIKKNYHCRCFVLSSFSKDITCELLNKAEYNEFDLIFSKENSVYTSGNLEDVFEILLKNAVGSVRQEISKDEILYIGCNKSDVLLAHKIGILVALYYNGMNRNVIDDSLSHDFVVRVYGDLWKILNNYDSQLLFMESMTAWKSINDSINFRSIRKKDLKGQSYKIFFAGRYFNLSSHTNKCFQLRAFSKEILHYKDNLNFSNKWCEAIRRFIANQCLLNSIKHFSIILTCIPFRRNRSKRLECLLKDVYKYIQHKPISLDCDLHIIPDLLEFDENAVSNHHDAQNRLARFKNINEHLHVKHKDYIKNCEKIIIIDDITTSGASLIEASKKLKDAGAKEIICFAFAQAVDWEFNSWNI